LELSKEGTMVRGAALDFPLFEAEKYHPAVLAECPAGMQIWPRGVAT
jgi:hypothetical protein